MNGHRGTIWVSLVLATWIAGCAKDESQAPAGPPDHAAGAPATSAVGETGLTPGMVIVATFELSGFEKERARKLAESLNDLPGLIAVQPDSAKGRLAIRFDSEKSAPVDVLSRVGEVDPGAKLLGISHAGS